MRGNDLIFTKPKNHEVMVPRSLKSRKYSHREEMGFYSIAFSALNAFLRLKGPALRSALNSYDKVVDRGGGVEGAG